MTDRGQGNGRCARLGDRSILPSAAERVRGSSELLRSGCAGRVRIVDARRSVDVSRRRPSRTSASTATSSCSRPRRLPGGVRARRSRSAPGRRAPALSLRVEDGVLDRPGGVDGGARRPHPVVHAALRRPSHPGRRCTPAGHGREHPRSRRGLPSSDGLPLPRAGSGRSGARARVHGSARTGARGVLLCRLGGSCGAGLDAGPSLP